MSRCFPNEIPIFALRAPYALSPPFSRSDRAVQILNYGALGILGICSLLPFLVFLYHSKTIAALKYSGFIENHGFGLT